MPELHTDTAWVTASSSRDPQLLLCTHYMIASCQQTIVHDAATGLMMQLPNLHSDAKFFHGDGQLVVIDGGTPRTRLRCHMLKLDPGQRCQQLEHEGHVLSDPMAMLLATTGHHVFILETSGQVAAINVQTLAAEHCQPLPFFDAEGHGREMGADDIFWRVEEAAASPNAAMLALALAISDMGQGDQVWVQVQDVATGECIIKMQCYQPNLSWSPRKALLAVRGCTDTAASRDLSKSCWIMNANSRKILPLNIGNAGPGNMYWAPGGDLLAVVCVPHAAVEGDRVGITVFDALKATAVWSTSWCAPGARLAHPHSAWAVPASWSHADISSPRLARRNGEPSAFIHAAKAFVRLQQNVHGQWSAQESQVHGFANSPVPQLDPTGCIIAGVDERSQLLVHHEVKTGKRCVIFQEDQLPCSSSFGNLVWAPIPPGWLPLYACVCCSRKPDGQSTVHLAVVDAHKHRVAHFYCVPELASSSIGLSAEDIELCWSPDSCHVVINSCKLSRPVVVSWPVGCTQ